MTATAMSRPRPTDPIGSIGWTERTGGNVDFTVRTAAVAREFTDRHDVPADSRELVANSIAMHHTLRVRRQVC